jgi:hypothetical protein
VNLYGYCLGDPVGLADPAGLLSSLDTPEGQALIAEIAAEDSVLGPQATQTIRTLGPLAPLAGKGAETLNRAAEAGSEACPIVAETPWWRIAYLKGQTGESYVGEWLGGVAKNTSRIYSELGNYRIPDFIFGNQYWEAKNIVAFRLTPQMLETASLLPPGSSYNVAIPMSTYANISPTVLQAARDAGVNVMGVMPW